jgi:nucleobase:cation symporter-1, NCS1 family
MRLCLFAGNLAFPRRPDSESYARLDRHDHGRVRGLYCIYGDFSAIHLCTTTQAAAAIVSAAVVIVFEVVLLIWSLATMGSTGFGDTISSTTSSSGWMIAYGIISTIGSIAAGILNQTDYARFARSPRDAIWGQIISSALCAISCSVIGILVTAATQNRYGEAMWNLPNLLSAVIETGGSRSRAAAFFGGVALVVSQIGVNVPGNALSGGSFFSISRSN